MISGLPVIGSKLGGEVHFLGERAACPVKWSVSWIDLPHLQASGCSREERVIGLISSGGRFNILRQPQNLLSAR